jgi:gas vesicle protein
MNSGKVLIGILAGAAVGAALGILFAPDKGCDTRRKISEKSHEYTNALGNRCNAFVESLTQKLESMRGDVTDQVDNVKQTAQDLETELMGAAKHKS